MISALLSAPKMRGRGYIRALPYIIKEREEEKAFKIYISDTLRLIGKNTASLGGEYYPGRFIDLIEPKEEKTQTAEEIIDNMKNKLRKLGKGGGG